MVDTTKTGKGLRVLYPDFGRRVDTAMRAAGLNNEEVARALGMKRGEMVRRYRRGMARPEDDVTLKRLATLLDMSPEMLMWGAKPVPGVALAPVVHVTPEEQILLDRFRQLPGAARKVLMQRARQLVAALAPASAANPYGRGHKTTEQSDVD